MAKGFKLAIAAAVLAMTASVSAPVVGAGADESIKMRVDLMKAGIGKPFGAIKAYIEKGQGTAEDAAKNAMTLSESAKKIAGMFPKGSGRDEIDPKMTRALPSIWTQWSGFESAANALSAESAKLATVIKGGDMGAIKAQYAAVGKNGCGACHKNYRGDKVK